MDNIKKVQDCEKMSGVSKVVSDRDRARLRLKESIMELAAARGQEDDVIGKLIVKVNEVFNALVDSHVEMVLSLGEDLSDEIHENFMYEASDERDEAVEEAEEGKVKAKEIIKEKTIAKESIKVNNLGLMGKKDQEELFDEKLEISRKISQEVAESELFCMFSAWVDLRNARPDASLQRGEVPHEVSRALNRAISIKQKLPSIQEEIFDGDAERKAAANEREEYKVAVEPKAASHVVKLEGNKAGKLKQSAVKDHKLRYIAQDDKESIRIMGEGAVVHTPSSIEFYDPKEKLFGNVPKVPNIAVKVHREVEATAADESHVTGEKLVNSFIPSSSIEFYDTGEKLVNKSGVEAQKEIKLFNEGGEAVRISNTSEAFPSSINECNSKFTQLEKSEEINSLFKHVDNEFKLEQMCDNIIPSKGFAKLNFLYKHGDDKLKLEQQLGSLQHARDLARLKLSGPDYAKRCSGSIVLIAKCGLIKKGVGGGNQLEQHTYIICEDIKLKEFMQSTCVYREDNKIKVEKQFVDKYVYSKSAMAGQLGYDNGKLAEYIRGAKHPTQHKSDTFEKEQQFVGRHQARVFTNSLQQARDPARLNLSGLTYVRKSVENIGLGISYDPGEKLFNKPWSKSFARLKLTGTIYLEKRTGGITLIVKAEFSRKGIGDSSLFERSVFIARSSVDTVPVFKDNKLKVPEAIRLKEENSQK